MSRGVHRADASVSREDGNRCCGVAFDVRCRGPRSVHGSFKRERVEERNGVLAAVVGKVPVVVIDHHDARAHEAGDRKTGTPPRSRAIFPPRDVSKCVLAADVGRDSAT